MGQAYQARRLQCDPYKCDMASETQSPGITVPT